MSNDSEPLSEAQAEAIWAILEEECGASRDHGFVHHQTSEHVVEWRFMGALGFGGKFWRNPGRRPDETWGERWYVNYYAEDEAPERRAAMERANARLWDLQRTSTPEASR